MRIFELIAGLVTWSIGWNAVAWAQEAAAQGIPPQPTATQRLIAMTPMLLIVYLIFYFLVIKPQNKRLSEHETLLNSLNKGEVVIADSGIIGRVAGIEKEYILLEVANNVKIKVEKAHITKRQEKPQKPEKQKKPEKK